MYSVCFGYVNNKADAEDILQEGFLKIFKNLDRYRHEGSFEGWIRKIITRTALIYLRDNKKFTCHIPLEYSITGKESNILDTIGEKEIRGIITKLPTGCKTIFIMYVIEGYNHRQIAEILGCTESTSKSQFYRSRRKIQKSLTHNS
jgi:RNA polymerase sigma-70 factor (ECF subfamily)